MDPAFMITCFFELVSKIAEATNA